MPLNYPTYCHNMKIFKPIATIIFFSVILSAGAQVPTLVFRPVTESIASSREAEVLTLISQLKSYLPSRVNLFRAGERSRLVGVISDLEQALPYFREQDRLVLLPKAVFQLPPVCNAGNKERREELLGQLDGLLEVLIKKLPKDSPFKPNLESLGKWFIQKVEDCDWDAFDLDDSTYEQRKDFVVNGLKLPTVAILGISELQRMGFTDLLKNFAKDLKDVLEAKDKADFNKKKEAALANLTAKVADILRNAIAEKRQRQKNPDSKTPELFKPLYPFLPE